jgi:hypothetical protein
MDRPTIQVTRHQKRGRSDEQLHVPYPGYQVKLSLRMRGALCVPATIIWAIGEAVAKHRQYIIAPWLCTLCHYHTYKSANTKISLQSPLPRVQGPPQTIEFVLVRKSHNFWPWSLRLGNLIRSKVPYPYLVALSCVQSSGLERAINQLTQ